MLKEMINVITSFKNNHLEQNEANERKLEAKQEDKKIETFFGGSKFD